MFDIRYHLISLVAVFLALALGILLGTVVAGKGTLSRQQDLLVEGIRKDVGRVERENRALQKELEQEKKFEQEVLVSLVKGQLSGKRMAILSTTALPPNLKKKILEVLNQAGAEVAFIYISPQLNLDSPKVKEKLKEFLGENLSESGFKKKFFEKVAAEINLFTEETFIQTLTELKLLKVEGNLGEESIILFGGGKEASAVFNQIHLPLIEEFQKLGLPLLGVEESQAKVSHTSFYQGKGLSTVDNVDNSAGLISLVYVLKGASGNFGTKPTAQALLPSLTP